jgi:hypothetical protein
MRTLHLGLRVADLEWSLESSNRNTPRVRLSAASRDKQN